MTASTLKWVNVPSLNFILSVKGTSIIDALVQGPQTQIDRRATFQRKKLPRATIYKKTPKSQLNLIDQNL
jgi:hypothetical protein